MTRAADVLDALSPLLADLTRELPAEQRYQRLLATLCRLLPCDAAALLRLEGGDTLVPLSVQGLCADTLGRRFAVDAHPRLKALLQAPGPTRFAGDCELPDPYDGLVEGAGDRLEVHDCMGCALRVGTQVWGVLTLDALQENRFSQADMQLLQWLADLAAATVAAVARMNQLTQSAESERSRAEAYRLAATLPERPVLAGQSAAFRQLSSDVALVAPSDLTVLITGETGVGKELVARQLHAGSPRADKVFVSVNCAALPETLVESELFGHVRGAFSGAVGERRGRFDMAHGGTLFLDEIGELPLAVQAKLLRALQDGQLQRLGSDREHHVDVRLIAATNRDLAAEVRAGRFRADLYHRLSVFPLQVPPLRARGRDVLILAGTFIEESRRRMGLSGLRLSASAQAALLAHDWPGNVRELEYLVARAALKARGRHGADAAGTARPAQAAVVTLEADDLSLGPSPGPGRPSAAPVPNGTPDAPPAVTQDLRSAVDAFQRHLVEQALAAHAGNTAAAARALGLDRANLVRLAARLGVRTAARPGTRTRHANG